MRGVSTVADRGEGIGDLREALIASAPDDFVNAPAIVGDLVPPGELALLVVPIDLEITNIAGRDFPDDLTPYDLVVHCGACMWNRRSVLSRIARCRDAGVPITNYGLTIAYTLGIFERALRPFPTALETYRALRDRLPHGAAPGEAR
ncbi:MAG: hypothetical protein ACOC95_03975 [Planctomycetota bacterium]